jgi:IS5 family transposase
LLGFARVVDFEIFRPELEKALAYANGTEGGRPPLDCVMMFKVLVVQAANNLSDDRTEFLVNDRLSFMRFLGLTLADKAPDAKTIWAFRERLTRAGAIENLFKRFDDHVKASGYLATSGQIVDASLIAAPKQRNTQEEKRAIKEGRIPGGWNDKPAKLRQKGSRRALDGKVLQSQTEGGWDEARARSRHSAFWLQEPCFHRPRRWAHPPLAGHRRLDL